METPIFDSRNKRAKHIQICY